MSWKLLARKFHFSILLGKSRRDPSLALLKYLKAALTVLLMPQLVAQPEFVVNFKFNVVRTIAKPHPSTPCLYN